MFSFDKIVNFFLKTIKNAISGMIKMVKIYKCLLTLICHFV